MVNSMIASTAFERRVAPRAGRAAAPRARRPAARTTVL